MAETNSDNWPSAVFAGDFVAFFTENNTHCLIVADSFERVQGEIFNLSEDRPGELWTFTNPHKTHDGKWCAQGRKR